MATEAEIGTKIQAIEDELANLTAGVDFNTEGPEGGRIEIRNVVEARKQLMRELTFWRRRLWAVQGGKVAEPARPGIDVERETDNGDIL